MLVTAGPGSDPHRFGPQPPNVFVTDFAPHALLLPHCAGLVTQGGPATILAALCHGLPHLILPQGADQFVNSVTAAAAGVALVVQPSELTPEVVAANAARLLEDPALTRRARVLQAEIAELPTAAEVLDTLLAA